RRKASTRTGGEPALRTPKGYARHPFTAVCRPDAPGYVVAQTGADSAAPIVHVITANLSGAVRRTDANAVGTFIRETFGVGIARSTLSTRAQRAAFAVGTAQECAGERLEDVVLSGVRVDGLGEDATCVVAVGWMYGDGTPGRDQCEVEVGVVLEPGVAVPREADEHVGLRGGPGDGALQSQRVAGVDLDRSRRVVQGDGTAVPG